MKSIPSSITEEQIESNQIPALKAQIQTYDFPDESSFLRYGAFDWVKVHENALTSGAKACIAYDGSLVFYNGTSTVRITSPTSTSGYSSWSTSGTMAHYHECVLYDIVASPASAEVLAFKVGTNKVTCYKSTDNGANFDAGTDIPVYLYYHNGTSLAWRLATPSCIAAAYDASGNACLAASYGDSAAAMTIGFIEYKSGAWVTTGGGYLGWSSQLLVGVINKDYFIKTTAINIKNISIAHDGDWICTLDLSQRYSKLDGYGVFIAYAYLTQLQYVIFGDGESVTDRVVEYEGILNISNKAKINSFSDLSGFSSSVNAHNIFNLPSGVKSRLIAQQLTEETFTHSYTSLVGYGMPEFGEYKTVAQITETKTIDLSILVNAYSYLFKVGGVIYLSVCDADSVYFYKIREDSVVADGLFQGIASLSNEFPLAITAGSTYAYAYSANQIFYSPVPSFWSIPTVGTGAGSYDELTTSGILGVQEVVNNNATSTLDIIFNNYDDTFDTVGSGSISCLALGSRLNLFLGFNISGVDTTTEYARYFVDSWEWSSEPNLSLFTLHCIDAWGLLERYRFPVSGSFNYIGAATTYTAYQLIEMMVQCIGGTLTYVNRSSSITSIYPRIDIAVGDSAASVLRRLLALVPDKIRFFGNTGTILYPQSTDVEVYYYQAPT